VVGVDAASVPESALAVVVASRTLLEPPSRTDDADEP
jgi:hypothetical protein